MTGNKTRIFILFILILIPIYYGFSQIADSTYNINTFYENTVDTQQSITSDFENWPKNQTTKSDIFYDSLKAKAGLKRWSRELHNMLVLKSKSTANGKYQNGYDRVSYFEQYSQKYIRKIIIEQIDVFGPSITDTSKQNLHWSQKLGNGLHISTSKSAIRKNLFISENERIDPYLLADNERLLRSKPNLQDARIYAIPIKNCTDSVDIQILTKDVWPVALGIEIFDIEYGKVGLWNNNFLGLGHNFNFTGYYNLNRDPKFGYRADYRIPNIAHTFTTLDLRHIDIWNYKANRVSLSRDFFTPELRIGGGLSYEKVDRTSSIITFHSVEDSIKIKFENYDAWLGYSLPLKRVMDFRLRKSYFITARVQQYQFLERPIVDTFYLHEYQNRTIFLLSTGLVWQGYQGTHLVYGFGDTEDLPYGSMIKLTIGHERSEFDKRPYASLTIAGSKYMNKIGYFSHFFEFGSYFNHHLEQGAINYKFQYFSPMFGSKRHIFRQFARVQYTQGYKRFDDEFLEIRNNNGIRGLNYNTLKGDKRLLFNTELVYYSPQYLYGFRFVYFLFFDGGFINYQNNALFDNQLSSSLGIGFRFRNERLVFNTIQFRACIFPFTNQVPANDKQYLDLYSSSKVRFPEFANKIPGVIKY
jgi:hypothetical protein